MCSSTLDVLAVLRAPLERFPPSLMQVSLLAGAGLRVGVADCFHPDYTEFSFGSGLRVDRFHLGAHTQLYNEGNPSMVVRIWRALSFQVRVRRLIRRVRPKVVIAFDPNAMVAVGKLWNLRSRAKLIWHYHELMLPEDAAGGVLNRRAVGFACDYADRPDLLVFPDRGRASLFRKRMGLDTDPGIVMNCPLRQETVPAETLTSRLLEFGVEAKDRVYFQGGIGPSRCFETIVQSMIHWPQESILVLVGPVAVSYRETLLGIARDLGVATRIVFLDPVPYEELAALSAGATVGLSFVAGDDREPNLKFCAGASNKRFEYMAAGLPQVSNLGPDMGEIIEEPGCGRLVDLSDPERMGCAIADLLSHPGDRMRCGENARRAHLERFCYEVQFQAVFDQIHDWCAAG